MNLPSPESMMASFALAIDMITEQFCCRPYNLTDASPPTCRIPNDEEARASERKHDVSPSLVKAKDDTMDILIPTLESDGHSALKPRQILAQRKDTPRTAAIVEPPAITRFTNPWILIAQDTPRTPRSLIPDWGYRVRPRSLVNEDFVLPFPSITEIEAKGNGGLIRPIKLAPRWSLNYKVHGSRQDLGGRHL